jgi:hypothetical protein
MKMSEKKDGFRKPNGKRGSGKHRDGNGDRGFTGTDKRGSNRYCPMDDVANHKVNDPGWYYSNEQMLKDVASIPMGIPAGYPIPVLGGYFPGIMTMEYAPSVGITQEGSSPINVAAQALYSFMTHINSGSTNTEAPDNMMYLIAMDSLFTMYAEYRRAYGVAQVYARQNVYYANRLLEALNWDAEDVVSNLNAMRANINQLAVRLSRFAVPGNMTYGVRHIWMSSKVWCDDDGPKSQLYAYKLGRIFKWASTKYETGTALENLHLAEFVTGDRDGKFTVSKFNAAMNNLIDELVYDSDIGIITRDIIHSFDNNELTVLSLIPEDYAVIPEYSMEVCSQFQNAVTLGEVLEAAQSKPSGGYDTEHGCDVYQEAGLIKWSPYFTGGNKATETGRLINFRKENVTPSDIIVATRLKSVAKSVFTDATYGKLTGYDAIGSDYLVDFRVWKNAAFGGFTTMLCYSEIPMSDELGIIEVADVEKFDFHPYQYIFDDTISGQYNYKAITGDVGNYATIDTSIIKLQHQMALLKMFEVPGLGKRFSITER